MSNIQNHGLLGKQNHWHNRMLHEEVGDVMDKANAVVALSEMYANEILTTKANTYLVSCARDMLTASLELKSGLQRFYFQRIERIRELNEKDNNNE